MVWPKAGGDVGWDVLRLVPRYSLTTRVELRIARPGVE